MGKSEVTDLQQLDRAKLSRTTKQAGRPGRGCKLSSPQSARPGSRLPHSVAPVGKAPFFRRLLQCMSLLLAQSGHFAAQFQCLLLGVERTSIGAAVMFRLYPWLRALAVAVAVVVVAAAGALASGVELS